MTRTQEYKAGLYCRLSVDDGTSNESMSIGNQKSMLTDYVRKQGWRLEQIYVDDGWSGTSFDRPDFQRMIGDIEAGRINCVVVKDLSRLGRNYILCGQYTEIYFPSKNVRFIALNDGIDSIHSNNDIAPFKNILNDMYAKDISVKVRSALFAKAKRGEYLGSCDPYGYLRDPKDKHHLIINPEVAPVVTRMFELVVAGYGLKNISKLLNAEGILSPADYDDWRNHDPADGEFTPQYEWSMSVVRNIVRNELFIGNMVQCRKRSESYRTQKIVWNPKEDWIVVEGTHEGIVSKKLFDRAQKAMEGRTRLIKTQRDQPHLFSGLFYCENCGRMMAHHARGDYDDYFSCGRYRADGNQACTSHHIQTRHLVEAVLQDIRWNVQTLQEDEAAAVKRIMASKCAEEEKRLADAQRELQKQRKRQSELDQRIKKVYEDNVAGKLPDDLFSTFLRDYESEKVGLTESVRALEDSVRMLESAARDVSQFVALLREHVGLRELDRPTLLKLVDRISIEEPAGSYGRKRQQTLHIHYKLVGEI